MTQLDKLLHCISHNHVYIQTHNCPDPDAIASAYGLQKLLSFKKILSTICYYGKIDRHNTLRMIQEFNIEVVNINSIPPLSQDETAILVDSQKGNSNIKKFASKKILCIDHHPIYEKTCYEFKDIRPEWGACSSIIAEYFFENDIPLDTNTATALLYGIKVDTANLTRAVSDHDLEIFYRLSKLRSKETLLALEQNILEFNDLNSYANAIRTIKVYNDISFANPGKDCPEALIASISDFMLSLAEVRLSIVYSIQDDGIKFSVRSKDEFYDAGHICNLTFQKIGWGGGHTSMAGGFIDSWEDHLPKGESLSSSIEQLFMLTISSLYSKPE